MSHRTVIQAIIFTCRLVLGGLFVAAAVFKIPDAATFAREIANYKMPLPVPFINAVAVTLPWIELLAGLLLILGLWHVGDRAPQRTSRLGRLGWFFYRHFQRGALFILSGLLVFFIGLLAVTMVRGIDANCGCFGPLTAQRVGLPKILENLFFLLFSIPLYLAPRHPAAAPGDDSAGGP
ncbi:MAG: DoxX family membrane protein [Acidobacteria bacterium]|nr:DoxX family membrane protein [Acidobacteriota bacterium]